MPQITVEYSDSLAAVFDHREFALALHPLVVAITGARPEGCKTRFRRLGEAVIGDGSADHAIVHMEIALLSGRSPQVRHELGRAALALLDDHLTPEPGLRVQTSIEVRDMAREHYYAAH